MNVVGYIRVSTADQADSGLGLEAQERAIRTACDLRGWSLAVVFRDAGVSGKSLRRPGLDEALKAVENEEAEAIVAAKLDRLSRSLLDFAGLMERSRRKGWALVALDLGVDTTTPSGELVANTMASFAQFERRLIGERTKDALAVKKAQGVKLGRPRTLSDEVIAEIRQRHDDGESYAAIARHLDEVGVPTAQGGRRWYPATVRKVLLGGGPADRQGPVC